MILWTIIENLGRDKVYYCDTDSIKIKLDDLPDVKYEINPTKLGALKVEDMFTRFEIYGNKHYISGDTKHIKGVPKDSKQVGDYLYQYKNFNRQATHLRKNENHYFLVTEVIKDVTPDYDKGIVLPDNTIVPFHLSPSDQF